MPALSLSERVSTPPLNRAERRAAVRQEHKLRPRYVSVAGGCQYAGDVSKSYFYEWFMPRVRTIKIGKRTAIELDSLDEVLDELADAG